MKTNSNPKYSLRELFENMSGDTTELRDLFSKQYGMPKWKISDYISGRAKTLKLEHAIDFIKFYNQNRVDGASELQVNDLEYAESVLNLETIGIGQKEN